MGASFFIHPRLKKLAPMGRSYGFLKTYAGALPCISVKEFPLQMKHS